MPTSLAEAMREQIAATEYEEAAKLWYFVHDPGLRTFQPPKDLEELFQLVAALSLSGHVGRALKVTYHYPDMWEGEMGGDVRRVLGIGELLRGNIDEAIERLEAAIESRDVVSPKLALDHVGLARVHLLQDDPDEAFYHINSAFEMVGSLDPKGTTPVARHVDYWHIITEPVATGAVDLERATKVSEADKAAHRRKIAKQLMRTNDPKKPAWKAVEREHALPTQGIIFRRIAAPDDDPWGWFLSYR